MSPSDSSDTQRRGFTWPQVVLLVVTMVLVAQTIVLANQVTRLRHDIAELQANRNAVRICQLMAAHKVPSDLCPVRP